jgi:hypothetical protein
MMHRLATDEIGIAAFMRARSARLVEISGNGSRLTFHFDSPDPTLIDQYYAAAPIPALAIIDSLHFLRRELAKARGASHAQRAGVK